MSDFIEKIISKERFSTYQDLEKEIGNGRTAEQLYKLNILYSKELYALLSGLEIAVRNRFHRALGDLYGKEDWFSKAPLRPKHKEQVDQAIDHLVRTKKSGYVISDLIAQLNFGFWVHLCDRPYEKEIWNRCLYRCFPYWGRKPNRTDIEQQLNQALILRNKIAHLEPVIKQEPYLIQNYLNVKQLTYAISPEASEWFCAVSAFEKIWNNRSSGA